MRFLIMALVIGSTTLFLSCTKSEKPAVQQQAAANPEQIYNFQMDNIDGQPIKLDKYKGKVLLVVNVASECGYTYQYKAMQNLYEIYKDRGLEILAFPANDFGEQEPGSDQEIKEFTQGRFGVTFPMFSKISVNGETIHPLFDYLTDSMLHGNHGGKLTWNFNKILLDREGSVIRRFTSEVDPDSDEMKAAIESVL